MPVSAGAFSAHQLAVFDFVGDTVDLRGIRMNVVAHGILQSVLARRAEQRPRIAAERNVLGCCRNLVAEDQETISIEPNLAKLCC